jgi:acyl-coenzyme A thioesterase PaaI-like protein
VDADRAGREHREGDVVCRTQLDRRTRTNAALRSEVVHEDSGKLLATAVGTYAIFRRD